MVRLLKKINEVTTTRLTGIRESGFSLLEVLVALLVLSIGLLGLAALQVASLKANHGAYQRTQATYLAYDIMDRMRANRAQALQGDYNLEMGADPPDVDNSASGTTLAEIDLDDWMTNFVEVLLPDGDASVSCTASADSSNVDTDICEATVQWSEARLGGTATDQSTTSQFIFESRI